VTPWTNYFEFIGIAIGQTRYSRFGNFDPEETVTMFLNVKLERKWIFNVVNDKKIQFKTEFGTNRISWTDAWSNNHSEKVSLNIFFYFLILSIVGFYLSIYFLL
jgi:hypothetical protein